MIKIVRISYEEYIKNKVAFQEQIHQGISVMDYAQIIIKIREYFRQYLTAEDSEC